MPQPLFWVIFWSLPMEFRHPRHRPQLDIPPVSIIDHTPSVLPPKRSRLPHLVAIIMLLFGAGVAALLWYRWALSPVTSKESSVRVVVSPGETASEIGRQLASQHLIRSEFAFGLYTQLHGLRSKLQAGGYVLSPHLSTPSIVEHMTTGKTDTFNVTISPGLTLDELKTLFERYGYSSQEIETAFTKSYTHPLLASRPSGATLEGYIYPETYNVGADEPLSSLLGRSFDELFKVITENGYVEQYQKEGLSIHQAVTLASIVQKEVSNKADQKQVAQVFLKRLDSGIQLGSDVTFMYAAKLLGVEPSVDLDSAYNTRKYSGLPPGPISNMNPSALEAVAFPASGDYLYFVAGDDGTTYFSRTQAEHDANVAAHCKELCN